MDKVIYSDRTLLKQLMTILYDNALKYTDEDGEIQFEVQLKDKNLLLRVLDNGPGIRDEDKKRIFDRFTGSTRPEPVKRWIWFGVIPR